MVKSNEYVTILYGLSRSNIETGNFINHLINPLIFFNKTNNNLGANSAHDICFIKRD